MIPGIHPLNDPALYARAVHAALAALEAAHALGLNARKTMFKMDRAARAVFVAAGVARDVANQFAFCITCDIPNEPPQILRRRPVTSRRIGPRANGRTTN